MSKFRRALLPVAALLLAAAPLAVQAGGETFNATLTGAAQVPEPTKSKAEGTLQLKVSADGKEIAYTLSVTGISNADGADLHLGASFANGPAVVKLFPRAGFPARKGEFSGVLAQGKIDAGDLLGSMAGSKLQDLIDELKDGNAYVNVHTDDGAAPPNSGPGDYTLGEIRGQIK
jgi:hypothetical protein